MAGDSRAVEVAAGFPFGPSDSTPRSVCRASAVVRSLRRCRPARGLREGGERPGRDRREAPSASSRPRRCRGRACGRRRRRAGNVRTVVRQVLELAGAHAGRVEEQVPRAESGGPDVGVGFGVDGADASNSITSRISRERRRPVVERREVGEREADPGHRSTGAGDTNTVTREDAAVLVDAVRQRGQDDGLGGHSSLPQSSANA